MKNTIRAVFVLYSALALFPLSAAAAMAEKRMDANGYPLFTEAEVQEQKTKALKGDGKQALQLAEDPRISAKEQRYWETISAEDGFGPGMAVLGMRLADDDSDPLNDVRARYWLTTAKERHVKGVDYDLCKLDKKADPSLPDCVHPLLKYIPR